MRRIEEDHHGVHQRRVENIRGPLVAQQVTVTAAQILNHPEGAPHKHQEARRHQHHEVLLPRHAAAAVVLAARLAPQAPRPPPPDDEEEAEEDQLHEQADHDDVLAEVELALVGLVGRGLRGEHAAAQALDQEGQHVAADEDLGEPVGADEREALAARDDDEAAEEHVHGRGEEGGREEDGEGLDDVGGFVVDVFGGDGAGGVADYFDCVWSGLLVDGEAARAMGWVFWKTKGWDWAGGTYRNRRLSGR